MDEGVRAPLPGRDLRVRPDQLDRGAAATSGLDDCAVIDVGGTTADIGLLINGFPRETANEVKVAASAPTSGCPDVLSLGIGGWQHRRRGDGRGRPGFRRLQADYGGTGLRRIDSDRHRHRRRGRSRAGRGCEQGRAPRPGVRRAGARAPIAERVSEAVDRMRTSPEPIAVVAVGGGSIPAPRRASAVRHGAPAGELRGRERHRRLDRTGRRRDRQGLRDRARSPPRRRSPRCGQRAVDKAIADRRQTLDRVDHRLRRRCHIPYLPGNATRIRVISCRRPRHGGVT